MYNIWWHYRLWVRKGREENAGVYELETTDSNFIKTEKEYKEYVFMEKIKKD